MNVKIELNESSSNLINASKIAVDAGAGETLEEAFSRILSAKTVSDTDRKRILAVKEALEEGEITREQKAYEKGRKLSKAEVLRLYKIVEERSQERILNEMKESMPDNYRLITDEKSLLSMVAELNDEQTIVFDVETTGTDIWSDYIVGHVLSAVKTDTHYYIPTKHDTTDTQLGHDYVLDALKPIYEDETTLKIAHNAKFDIHMLRNEGITVRGELWDTQEAMRLLNENEPSYALKTLVTKFLGVPSLTYGQLFGKKGFNEVSDLLIATAYAAKDGDVTYALYEFQRNILSNRFPTIYDYAKTIEMPLLYAVVEMERTGFVIDEEYAKEYGERLTQEISDTEHRIKQVFGDINLNSPAQVKPAIEAHIGREIPNTDAKRTLKPLAKDYVVVEDLLHYKELTKMYGTYVDKLPQFIREKTGKLMANYNTNGAKTGRFSSGGGSVNLQNQPYEARKLFVAPKGSVIIGGDFSQQEYRALAAYSGEEKLKENYRNGTDLYSTVASEIFNKPLSECGDGSIYRKQTKVILLAIAYGTGARTLSMQLGKSVKEAQKILDDFRAKYTTLGAWIENNRTYVQKHGFVWLGDKCRKRRLPDALDPDSDYWYSAVMTQSTNAIIQGSAAIQTKATLIELQKLCERKTNEGKGEWRLWCVVHDEALIQVPDTVTAEDIDDFRRVMVETYEFGDVPNKTDIELSLRWGEGMSEEEWFKRKETE